MSLVIGQTAPDFTIYDSEKQVILSELKCLPILLLFFSSAFTAFAKKSFAL
jgi:peroxiredoxin